MEAADRSRNWPSSLAERMCAIGFVLGLDDRVVIDAGMVIEDV